MLYDGSYSGFLNWAKNPDIDFKSRSQFDVALFFSKLKSFVASIWNKNYTFFFSEID